MVLSVLVGSSSPDEVSDFYFHDWAMLDLRNFLLKRYQCNKQSLSVFTPFTTFVGFVETKRKILSFPKCCHAIIRVVRTILLCHHCIGGQCTFDCSFHLIFQFQAQYLHTVSEWLVPHSFLSGPDNQTKSLHIYTAMWSIPSDFGVKSVRAYLTHRNSCLAIMFLMV